MLVTETNKSREEFEYIDAVKRPKALKAEAHVTKVKGEPYTVYVGLLANKPYEIFITKGGSKSTKGEIVKKRKGSYEFETLDDNFNEITYPITNVMNDEQESITRLTSTSLRHGTDIKFIVEQLNKTSGDMFSFTKGLARVLKKYIPDGSKSTVKCLDCGSDNVIFEEGCNKCNDCGSSACG